MAAADRLLLSKTDLAGDCTALRAHLQALNGGTPILDTQAVHSGDQLLLGEGLRSAEPRGGSQPLAAAPAPPRRATALPRCAA